MGSALKIAMSALTRAGSAQIAAPARSLAIQACVVVITSIFVPSIEMAMLWFCNTLVKAALVNCDELRDKPQQRA
jgi:hypothetical protein